jgi:hypothetical protein
MGCYKRGESHSRHQRERMVEMSRMKDKSLILHVCLILGLKG